MAAIKGIMRQVEEKYCRHEISHLAWSSRLDLVAAANKLGEVTVHRLNWQRVYHLPAPDNSVYVVALAWRPDGRNLAIAYSNCTVVIANTERKSIDNTINLSSKPCYLNWTQETLCNRLTEYYFTVKDAQYTPPLLPFTGMEGNEIPADNFFKVDDQTNVNLLIVGQENGKILFYIYGMFQCGFIDLAKVSSEVQYTKIIFADLTKNFDRFYTVAHTGSEPENAAQVRYFIFEVPRLRRCLQDVYTVANQCCDVLSLIDYMNYAVRSITEAWENVLLNEMLLKLNEYAEGKERGALSTELLELAMFGTCPAHLETFLTNELSDKNIKRMSSSINMSHSAMLKLVINHLRPCTEVLLHKLTLLRGVMCFTSFNISDPINSLINNCLNATGAFYQKTNEMLSVLEESQMKYKAFFHWLTIFFGTLCVHRSPNDVDEITPSEIQFVCKHLSNIDRLSGESGYDKEELGQFLVDECLTSAAMKDTNSWTEFLEQNECLINSDIGIIPPKFKNYSLIMQQNHLKQEINTLLECYQNFVTEDCNVLKLGIAFAGTPSSYFKVIASISNNVLYVLSINRPGNTKNYIDNYIDFYELREINTSRNYAVGSIIVTDTFKRQYHIQDVEFYTEDVVSVLLNRMGEHDCNYYTQLQVSCFAEFCNELKEHTLSVNNQHFRKIENMNVHCMAVSGMRKVLVAVAEDKHKIRIFEMEADEEEEMSAVEAGGSDAQNSTNEDTSVTSLDFSTLSISSNNC